MVSQLAAYYGLRERLREYLGQPPARDVLDALRQISASAQRRMLQATGPLREKGAAFAAALLSHAPALHQDPQLEDLVQALTVFPTAGYGREKQFEGYLRELPRHIAPQRAAGLDPVKMHREAATLPPGIDLAYLPHAAAILPLVKYDDRPRLYRAMRRHAGVAAELLPHTAAILQKHGLDTYARSLGIIGRVNHPVLRSVAAATLARHHRILSSGEFARIVKAANGTPHNPSRLSGLRRGNATLLEDGPYLIELLGSRGSEIGAKLLATAREQDAEALAPRLAGAVARLRRQVPARTARSILEEIAGAGALAIPRLTMDASVHLRALGTVSYRAMLAAITGHRARLEPEDIPHAVWLAGKLGSGFGPLLAATAKSGTPLPNRKTAAAFLRTGGIDLLLAYQRAEGTFHILLRDSPPGLLERSMPADGSRFARAYEEGALQNPLAFAQFLRVRAKAPVGGTAFHHAFGSIVDISCAFWRYREQLIMQVLEGSARMESLERELGDPTMHERLIARGRTIPSSEARAHILAQAPEALAMHPEHRVYRAIGYIEETARKKLGIADALARNFRAYVGGPHQIEHIGEMSLRLARKDWRGAENFAQDPERYVAQVRATGGDEFVRLALDCILEMGHRSRDTLALPCRMAKLHGSHGEAAAHAYALAVVEASRHSACLVSYLMDTFLERRLNQVASHLDSAGVEATNRYVLDILAHGVRRDSWRIAGAYAQAAPDAAAQGSDAFHAFSRSIVAAGTLDDAFNILPRHTRLWKMGRLPIVAGSPQLSV